MTKNTAFVKKLSLNLFRNYDNISLQSSCCPVVLFGENGSGKTNILEAISLLSPGRGLRKAQLNSIKNINHNGFEGWSVSSIVAKGMRENNIGTGLERSSDSKRIIKIDGDKIKRQSDLTEMLSVIWLTPQIDGLFIEGSSDRRKFLDRLVFNFDSEHASRVNSYEYLVRERMKILQNNNYDQHWVSSIEAKIAQKTVAIAIARADTINYIQNAIDSFDTPFPRAIIGVECQVKDLIDGKTSLEAEAIIGEKLANNRHIDANSGRSNIGTHRSDFFAIHQEKNMRANLCSTGEQKALLLSIILAEARAKSIWQSSVPIILLDEVVSHLDNVKRDYLFDFILQMNCQVWMTGTSEEIFSGLNNEADFFHLANGEVVDFA